MTYRIKGASARWGGGCTSLLLVTAWLGCGGETEANRPTPTGSSSTSSSTAGAGGGGAGTGATAGAPMGGAAGALVGGGGRGGSGGLPGGNGGSGGSGLDWPDELRSLAVLDLGTWPTDESRTFPIAEHTLGFTVLVDAPADDDVIGIYQLRTPPPSSSVIIDFAMAGHDLQVFGDAGWCTAANPMSDSVYAWPVREGSWSMRLGSDGTVAEADVRIWARRTVDGAFHGGVVDVNVYLAPATVDQSYVTTVLEDHMFPFAGLALGNVQFDSLGSDATSIDSIAEYRALLASTAATGTAPALNIFVVGHFGGDYQGALGVAGGIPGSPMEHGTARSGLAYTPTGDPSYDGTILAHEMGHVAGLFHTTEREVEETNPLSDTPECAHATIQSNPNNCPDQSNLMFPIAYGGSTLSAAQIRVIEGCALYRGVLTEGGSPEPPLGRAARPSDDRALGAAEGGIVARRARAPRDELERLLWAHWCERGGDGSDLAIRLAGPDPVRRLAAIVADETAFDVARARALGLLARLAEPGRAARAELVALARRALLGGSTGRKLGLEAIGLLARLAPTELGGAAAAIPRGRDALVDAELRRLGLR